MRVLALADIHGNHGIYRRLPGLADALGADVVVLAGDLLGGDPDGPSIEDSQTEDARRILAILESCAVPILYVMGNDDMIEWAPDRPAWVALHGRRVEIGEFNFVGYQYSLPFMGGIFERPEEEIGRDLAAMEHLVDPRTILVTHSPAYGFLDHAAGGASAGSTAILRLAVTRGVRAHIHGHVHRCFGVDGRHFNVASGGRRLRGLVLDPATLHYEVFDEGEVASQPA